MGWQLHLNGLAITSATGYFTLCQFGPDFGFGANFLLAFRSCLLLSFLVGLVTVSHVHVQCLSLDSSDAVLQVVTKRALALNSKRTLDM